MPYASSAEALQFFAGGVFGHDRQHIARAQHGVAVRNQDLPPAAHRSEHAFPRPRHGTDPLVGTCRLRCDGQFDHLRACEVPSRTCCALCRRSVRRVSAMS